ncbi:MAG: glycosyltransferase family 2 protein [Flavobacteriaceae bacterium]|nr:glycosyltransferase family 2 protein [Flavobacteriaceae bacterium]
MKKKIDITIVIVNYKSWKHLSNCLDSILKIKQDEFLLEVIIVDNHSNDGVFNDFSSKYTSFKFIENTANNGFSNGCNLGARNAQGDFILFLNPDTIVNKQAILTLFQLAENNPNYGIVSCNIINSKGGLNKIEKIFPSFSSLFGFTRVIYRIINYNQLKEKYDVSKEIVFPDWVTGAVVFMSKEWFQKIGGWNEDYWMYSEDVDICKKVSNNGGLVALTRNAEIIHHHGGAARINTKTVALTKTEVIISNHVYINNHFTGFLKVLSLIILVLVILTTNFLLAIIGTIFFYIPKLKVRLLIFTNIIKYYTKAIIKGTWMSEKAMNFKIRQI